MVVRFFFSFHCRIWVVIVWGSNLHNSSSRSSFTTIPWLTLLWLVVFSIFLFISLLVQYIRFLVFRSFFYCCNYHQLRIFVELLLFLMIIYNLFSSLYCMALLCRGKKKNRIQIRLGIIFDQSACSWQTFIINWTCE